MNARQAKAIRAGILNARHKNWGALSAWTGRPNYKLFRRAFMATDLALDVGRATDALRRRLDEAKGQSKEEQE